MPNVMTSSIGATFTPRMSDADQAERASLNQQAADQAQGQDKWRPADLPDNFTQDDYAKFALSSSAQDPNIFVNPDFSTTRGHQFEGYLGANNNYFANQTPDKQKAQFDSLYGEGPKINPVSGASQALQQKLNNIYNPQIEGIKKNAENNQLLSYFDQQHQQLAAANQQLAGYYTAEITRQQKEAQDEAARAGVWSGVLGIAGAIGGGLVGGPAGAMVGAGIGQQVGGQVAK